jgi:hypothetical protein
MKQQETKKLKVGDKVYSSYFNAEITITRIEDDKNWWFDLNGNILKAQTPLSYFERR